MEFLFINCLLLLRLLQRGVAVFSRDASTWVPRVPLKFDWPPLMSLEKPELRLAILLLEAGLLYNDFGL